MSHAKNQLLNWVTDHPVGQVNEVNSGYGHIMGGQSNVIADENGIPLSVPGPDAVNVLCLDVTNPTNLVVWTRYRDGRIERGEPFPRSQLYG